MNVASVILLSLGTSVATTIGVLYAAERWHFIPEEQVERQSVPNLVGLTEGDARTNLEAAGLKLMVAGREPDAEAEPDTVIRQAPSAGQLVPRGDPVSLTFALPVPEVPDVAGKTVKEATRELEEAGFVVEVADAVPSADREAGQIVEQEPKAGTALEKKKTVTLTPSAGPAAVEVPKLSGLGLSKAKEIAEKAGLKLTVQWVSLAETVTYVVLRQIPAAGESVEPGSEVKVVINR